MTISAAQFTAFMLDDQQKKIVLWDQNYLFEGTDSVNIAAGCTTSASSTLAPFLSSYAVDGSTVSQAGMYWNNATINTFPQWLQVSFPTAYSINKVIVWSLADDYVANPHSAVTGETGTQFVLSDFEVQADDGTGTFVTVAHVTGNALLKCPVTFSGVSTTAFRIKVNQTIIPNGFARIVEVQAFQVVPTRGTFYLSDAPYATEPSATPANVEYCAIIVGVPDYNRSIDVGTLGGRMRVQYGKLVVDNADFHNSALLDLIIDGEDGTCAIGGENWARSDFRTLFVAKAKQASQVGTNIEIELTDNSVSVDTVYTPPVIGGTGPNANQPLPSVFGTYFAECILQDAATLRFRVASALFGAAQITEVYADGVKLSTGQWSDTSDGTLTLAVSQGGAKLIAKVTGGISPIGIGFGPTPLASAFFTFLWRTRSSTTPVAHSSWASGGATLNPILAIRNPGNWNVAQALDNVALSSNGFWGTQRDGTPVYGRIRPHALSTLGTPRYTLTDHDVLGTVTTARVAPQFSSVRVQYGGHSTFDAIAASVPPAAADVWRQAAFTYKPPRSAATDYAANPGSYHLSMTDSLEIETLIGMGSYDLSSVYAGNPITTNPDAIAWSQEYRNKLLPHLEQRTLTTRLIYYDTELADLIATNMPVKAGESVDTLWQVLGVDMKPTRKDGPGQIVLTLVRRRVPALTQIVDGTTAVVATPAGHGCVMATMRRSGNPVMATMRI